MSCRAKTGVPAALATIATLALGAANAGELRMVRFGTDWKPEAEYGG